jgi:hypothetical protein
VAEENTDTGTVLPFVVGVLRLEGGCQDINRTSKGVEGREIRIRFSAAGKAGKGGAKVGGNSQMTA